MHKKYFFTFTVLLFIGLEIQTMNRFEGKEKSETVEVLIEMYKDTKKDVKEFVARGDSKKLLIGEELSGNPWKIVRVSSQLTFLSTTLGAVPSSFTLGYPNIGGLISGGAMIYHLVNNQKMYSSKIYTAVGSSIGFSSAAAVNLLMWNSYENRMYEEAKSICHNDCINLCKAEPALFGNDPDCAIKLIEETCTNEVISVIAEIIS